ncbi:Hypothetical protein, putative [Bodo saltans]|uniref:Uncharacterized protein n=1 Tax=Bodo saltans TaxID=75058 RepID=A0A0S4IU33_BODSA|nr:Hypothetical protein, putative [Bodo saltans]|eukprot:CUF93161.1 Hypothetical protein, putative [Bodo saltans]
MRQTSSAGRRPPLRSPSASKQQQHILARPELSPPPLSSVAVGAAAAAMHRQAISASTSLQVTSRGADEMHQSNENSYHFGGGALETESEALRLNRLLSGSEVAALSDVFYRSFGAHVTPSTLPSFLTAVGIQHDVHQQQQQQQQQHQQSSGGHNKPGDDGNLFEFLRDIILKGVDLEVAFRQAKSTAPTPNSGAALHQGHNKSDSVGHGAVLHRALVKVLSARRLSTAAAAVGGPNTAGGGRLLSARGSLLNTPKTGHLLLPRGGHQHHHHQHLDGSAGGLSLLPPPRALPPTISLDLLCWIARILKDQAIARATASSASAGSNPELLEAYRSCADDVTGTVTVQSVKDRCTLFDVQLSFGSKAEAKKKKWKRQQTALLSAQQQRRNDASANDLPDDDDSDTPMPEYDEDEDDDDDDADAASKANNVELNPVQFAKLLHTRQHQQKSSTAHQGTGDNASPKKKSPPSPTTSSSSSSSSRESSLSMEGNTTFPTPHSASIAQSPLNATTGRQHRLQQLLNSSPNQARGTAQPGGTQQRYLSPKRFVAVPYTEEELQLFEDGSGALQQAPHDQTVLANTLLGTETCVRPSALLQSGGLRCHSAPLSGGASSIAFKRTQQLSGVVNSVTSLLGAHQRNSAASAVQPTMLPQQDVTDQSDVASLLAGGGSTIGGADVADNSSYYHQRSMMSPPSETGVLPPPPSLMATYFLAHQSRASGTERLSSRENELAVHRCLGQRLVFAPRRCCRAAASGATVHHSAEGRAASRLSAHSSSAVL